MVIGHGLCSKHYNRVRRYGSPYVNRMLPGNLKANYSKTPTYFSWMSMIGRCTNPNKDGYESYGGRGIKVCDRWKTYANFYEDMGERPKGMTLDRIDTDGDYELSNCRWSTHHTQALNRRLSIRNKSGYRGVCQVKKKWAAYIMSKGVNHRLGTTFNTPEEAALAYNVAALQYHGSEAKLNVIENKD